MLHDINENRRNIILAAHREVMEALTKQGVNPQTAVNSAVAATAKVASNMIGHEITPDMVKEVVGLT